MGMERGRWALLEDLWYLFCVLLESSSLFDVILLMGYSWGCSARKGVLLVAGVHGLVGSLFSIPIQLM